MILRKYFYGNKRHTYIVFSIQCKTRRCIIINTYILQLHIHYTSTYADVGLFRVTPYSI